MTNFTVKDVSKSFKEGFVVASVVFDSSKTQKIYTYVRKVTKENSTESSITIKDMKVIFNSETYDVVDVFEDSEYTPKKKSTKKTQKKTTTTAPKTQIEYTGESVKHEKFEMIKTCIENNIPVYLAGPAGSGKNHTLEQIAKEMGLDFYFTNSVQQEYKLTGFIDAGGVFHETEFYKAFKNGGLFFLDEMDASIPEVLVLLNAAIANGYFEFPNGKINAHENFRVVAAGNTVGNGADDNYTGRMVLDQATLDRFAIIDFDYDIKIEMYLAKGNSELVEFIESLRESATNNCIRATFSYRCISMVAKLEDKMDLVNIIKIAVVKGLDKDTVNTLIGGCNCDNKYSEALRELAA